ncbi:MAG: rhomboid family intramembrane serine protease GlpG [Moraxellaceae bacterium]|nr:rhomboid family intramembrane serine protease GlpG [Moraxellaceae bacterium]
MELVAFSEKRLALALSDYLRSIGIANHVEARAEGTVILLALAEDFARAQEEMKLFVGNPEDERYWQASWQSGQAQDEPVYAAAGPSAAAGWLARGGRVTRAVAALCVVLFIGLNVQPDAVFGALHYPPVLAETGVQWWRLLTPALMHAGLMHIAFNLLWWWEFGGLIERSQSGLRLLGVAVVIALVSNAAQGLQYGPHFLGLSGVIYGLLGYLWMYPLCNPAAGFRVRREIIGFMLGWLALGYTGLLDMIFGPISNTGHLSGLLAGMALGVLLGLVNRGEAARNIDGQD